MKFLRIVTLLVIVSLILYSWSAAAAKLLQSCLTLCDPIDNSPPGSPVPRILQARTLEWVAISRYKIFHVVLIYVPLIMNLYLWTLMCFFQGHQEISLILTLSIWRLHEIAQVKDWVIQDCLPPHSNAQISETKHKPGCRLCFWPNSYR